MTMTVKLDPHLEQRLRMRSAALGRPAGDIIREALTAWLAATPEEEASALSLGSDLFGRYAGAAELATERKSALSEAWAARHDGRRR